MAPKNSPIKRVTYTVEYKRKLAQAIIEFLNQPARHIFKVTEEDMRARGRTDPGWAREGVSSK
jgi:hypothetical protein